MILDEAVTEVAHAVQDIYDEDEAKNIARLLLEHITKLSGIEIILKRNEELTKGQRAFLDRAVARLRQHEPVQYIIHEAWFCGMKFYVDKNVLIPRPETEELVDWLIKEWNDSGKAQRLLDVGTGSGCIAVSLKKRFPVCEVWACDISDPALNIARMNADNLKATVDFVAMDFLSEVQRRQLPAMDLVIGNPPYVLQKDKLQMRKNVTDHEPATALFVPDDDALIFYKAIADFGKEKLHKDGKVYVEINEDLGGKVMDLFHSNGYQSVEIKKDLQGKNRMIKASRK